MKTLIRDVTVITANERNQVLEHADVVIDGTEITCGTHHHLGRKFSTDH